MKCLFYGDLDGRASAALVYRNYLQVDHIKETDIIEIKANTNFPIHLIRKNETVFLVNYLINANNMFEIEHLLLKTKNVTIIDFHNSTKNILDSNPKFKEGFKNVIINPNKSCVLSTYEYFYPREESIPLFIKYITGYYKSKNRGSLFFKIFMDSIEHSPCSYIWDELFYNEINLNFLIEKGKNLYKQRKGSKQ